ncbi:hypothetical protein Pmani_033388 [Petrolisthes manimaculis]|uniref:Uncharacterized protein n=1 Tax=Petrolisthes manimaculis TaxID=1843537 RepID=A0AAE1NQK0_9EUCA|nr:hypothetical protein Pmani_033388 [Petrolisthes manimaculis]
MHLVISSHPIQLHLSQYCGQYRTPPPPPRLPAACPTTHTFFPLGSEPTRPTLATIYQGSSCHALQRYHVGSPSLHPTPPQALHPHFLHPDTTHLTRTNSILFHPNTTHPDTTHLNRTDSILFHSK